MKSQTKRNKKKSVDFTRKKKYITFDTNPCKKCVTATHRYIWRSSNHVCSRFFFLHTLLTTQTLTLFWNTRFMWSGFAIVSWAQMSTVALAAIKSKSFCYSTFNRTESSFFYSLFSDMFGIFGIKPHPILLVLSIAVCVCVCTEYHILNCISQI